MKRNILMVISTLSGGGAEKNFISIANELQANEYNVTICTLLKFNNDDIYIDKNISIYKINEISLKKAFVPYIKFLIKNRNKFNLFFSTLTQVNLLFGLSTKLIASYFSNIKTIYRESNIPTIECGSQGYGFIYKLAYKLSYYSSDIIIAQSDDMKIDMINNFGIPDWKIVKINNPVDHINDKNIRDSHKYNEELKILCVGRLHKQKRYDRVLDIAEKLKGLGFKFRIDIYGTGPDADELINKTNLKKLNKFVCFCGYNSKVKELMTNYDCLLLTSDYEGFPNVAIEAISSGIPIISYNFPGGINEIVIDGFNGYLFSNNIEACQKIKMIKKSNFVKNNIVKDAVERFNREKILKQYIDEIGKLV